MTPNRGGVFHGLQQSAVAAMNPIKVANGDRAPLQGGHSREVPEDPHDLYAPGVRFATELTDRLARVRGSSEIDPDADEAAGRLKYPGDVWFLEWSATPVQPSSESQYRKALEALRRYNARLARGEAVFDRRADNLRDTLDRFASDLGSSSAALFERIRTGSDTLVDLAADDLFYAVKGRLYAYYLIVDALGRDFADVIRERNLARVWERAVDSLREAALLRPWWVTNGALDSPAVPNHLAAQGFLLLRARTQLREIVDILQK